MPLTSGDYSIAIKAVGGGLSWKSADYTAVAGDNVIMDCEAYTGDLTLTLPSSPTEGDTVKVAGNGLPTYAVLINFGSEYFKGSTAPSTVGIDTNMVEYQFVYRNSSTGWVVIPDADLTVV